MTIGSIQLPAGLEDDPEVRAAVKELAILSIRQAIDMIKTGAPPIKLQIMRTLLPQLSKAIQPKNEDENAEVKAMVEKMYAEVRGAARG